MMEHCYFDRAALIVYTLHRVQPVRQTPEKLFQAWLSDVTHNVESATSSNHIEQRDKGVQEKHEEEELNSPLFQIAGMFAIGEPGWADKHDEYLAGAYIENHANNDQSESERMP